MSFGQDEQTASPASTVLSSPLGLDYLMSKDLDFIISGFGFYVMDWANW